MAGEASAALDESCPLSPNTVAAIRAEARAKVEDVAQRAAARAEARWAAMSQEDRQVAASMASRDDERAMGGGFEPRARDEPSASPIAGLTVRNRAFDAIHRLHRSPL